MLLGGTTAELMGGEFWKGTATSGIVAVANHVAHRLGNNRLEKIKRQENEPCTTCPKQENSREFQKFSDEDG